MNLVTAIGTISNFVFLVVRNDTAEKLDRPRLTVRRSGSLYFASLSFPSKTDPSVMELQYEHPHGVLSEQRALEELAFVLQAFRQEARV